MCTTPKYLFYELVRGFSPTLDALVWVCACALHNEAVRQTGWVLTPASSFHGLGYRVRGYRAGSSLRSCGIRLTL
eukprot:COSAG04_NODE_16393_length_500_cov_1.159601_1_plen_74_part_01